MTSDTLIIDADGDLVLSFDPEECSSTLTDDIWIDADSSEDDSQIIDAEPSNTVSRILIKATDVSPTDISIEEPSESNDNSWVELKQVRMLVSSKHMSVASPVFKAMFQASSQEGIELKITGKVELSLRDEDSKAWNILLNIIHGRFRSVPLDINLPMFTQIALLCDKYQMHEVAYAFTPTWRMSAGHDSVSGEDIPRWIFIAWTFNMTDVLEEITKGLALNYTGNGIEKIVQHDYSTDSSNCYGADTTFIDELENSRQHAIAELVDMFDYTIQRYQEDSSKCSIRTRCGEDRVSYRKQCDSMILGMLLKGAIEQQIYPLPKKPYKEWSFSILEKKIKCIKPTSLCAAVSLIPDVHCDQDHGISKIMTSWIKHTAHEVTGLQLASLKRDASPEIQWPIR
ncbi:uncharacterized protein EAF02_004624 [Botrytis sinoallii]|uniref:uncharacterized protein n=1 Tax=Botrytis sinoallii TaxID=1463999 RepID=UPI0018FFB881|nr:uncharacterized protein EAF02_004624 [Botrytis sinoallii]KAF7884288.1 hypothetical protein EAF02_004624 [Botrytis sinoallii]